MWDASVFEAQPTRNHDEVHYRGDGTTRRDAAKEKWKWNVTRANVYACVYIRVCTYVPENGCRRFARVGSAILQRKPLASGQGRVSLRIGIRCSTPGYQQECFPHSASCAFISSCHPLLYPPSPSHPSSFLPSFPPHSWLFTCITFAEDTRKTLTRLCAFKVAS